MGKAALEPQGLLSLASVCASREPKTEDSFHCPVNVPGHILHPVTEQLEALVAVYFVLLCDVTIPESQARPMNKTINSSLDS